MKRSLIRIITLTVVVLASHTPGIGAQTADPQQPIGADQQPPVAAGEEAESTRGFLSALGHNLVDDLKHIPRKNSLYWLAGGAAGAALIHPYDGKINRHFMNDDSADGAFMAGKYIGNTAVLLGAAAATYVVGRSTDKPRVVHLGMDEIEAVLLAGGLAQTTKLIFRRERPVDPDGHQASGYSFPSGHATATFAAATVLQQHLGYKAGVPTYLVASYVAISRLQDNRHYASDVVMGAALGIVVGRSVTYHGRNFWGGPVFVPGGVAVMFVRR